MNVEKYLMRESSKSTSRAALAIGNFFIYLVIMTLI